MSKFFLGPNFREKLNMGSTEPIKFPSATPEEQAAQNADNEQEEIKKETKSKSKSDGKE